MPATSEAVLKEVARIARRMRSQGKTFAAIAAELEVSVGTVERWVKYRKPLVRKDRPPKKKAVSVRRKILAAGLASGKSVREAAMAAGCPTPRAASNYCKRAKNDPDFVEYFNRLMDKAGLDEETIARGLVECSQATKPGGYAVDKATGTISDKWVVPDYQVRHNTLRTALELQKRLNQRDADVNPAAAPVHLHLTVEQKRVYEGIVGGPLAFDTIDISPEVAAGEAAHHDLVRTERRVDPADSHPVGPAPG